MLHTVRVWLRPKGCEIFYFIYFMSKLASKLLTDLFDEATASRDKGRVQQVTESIAVTYLASFQS